MYISSSIVTVPESRVESDQDMPWYDGPDSDWLKYKVCSWDTVPKFKVNIGDDHPVKKLNELYTGLVYDCDSADSAFAEAGLFRMTVTVEGQIYEGMGNNKKAAKVAAATAALDSLAMTGVLNKRQQELQANREVRRQKTREFLQNRNQQAGLGFTGAPGASFGFGGNRGGPGGRGGGRGRGGFNAGRGGGFTPGRGGGRGGRGAPGGGRGGRGGFSGTPPSLMGTVTTGAPAVKPVNPNALPKTPCQKLNELYKAVPYKVIGQMGTYPSITFTMQAVVNGVSYLGSGRNQKIAKANAAEKALRSLNKWTADDETLKAQREKDDAEKYHPPTAPNPRKLTDDPRGGHWQKKEKPFKSVMSQKWTTFTAGGELGTTTGVKSHGVYTSKVDVTKNAADGGDTYSYQAADYGYGHDQSASAAPPPPPAPPQQQFDPSSYGYGSEYDGSAAAVAAPYTDPSYAYPYGSYGYGYYG